MKVRNFFLVGLLVVNFTLKAETKLANAQAMFIFNFLRYVSWPEDIAQNEYLIGVAGDSEVYTALINYTKSREIAGKSIKVIICSNCKDMLTCQLLFIPKSKCSRLSEIVEKLRNSSCLTVFDNCEGLAPSLAAIDLVLTNNRLNYKVNTEAASQYNLIMSNILVNMSL